MVRKLLGLICGVGLIMGVSSANLLAAPPEGGESKVAANWTQTGWGGGGFYWSAAFHPTKDGVIYLGSDVLGVYKSEDHGKNFRFINNGIADYGVYSLAVDRLNPEIVYAGTEGGLCKSTNGGEKWEFLPRTEKKDLRITSERNKSIRSIAVDPSNSSIVYTASPAGKVYKSTDGGQTWNVVYEVKGEQADADVVRVQFGKNNGEYFGGIWIPFEFPKDVKNVDCVGFGFAFKGDGSKPDKAFVTLKTTSGATYTSKNLTEMFKDTNLRDVVFTTQDFTLDAAFVKKNPDKAKDLAAIDWSTVNRMDFTCVGSLPTEAYVGKIGKLFFALTRSADGQTGTADKPILATVKEFSKDKTIQSYGNLRVGKPQVGSIYSVAVAPKEPSMVLAATNDVGVIMSKDAGQTWTQLKTPQVAKCIAIAANDPSIIYGAFAKDGVWKSTDKGQTWTDASEGLAKGSSITEVAVSPTNPDDVFAIGAVGWGGDFFYSNDGGKSWHANKTVNVDADSGDPTLPKELTKSAGGLSIPTNLAINPVNPKELYISANWRCCLSNDGGKTLVERMRGADISCIYDIRFSGNRTYAAAMDEGTFVSDDDGKTWKQLWPLKFTDSLSGHNWRLDVANVKGADRIIASVSPWNSKYPNRVVVSEDGGKTFKVVTEGLPNFIPHPNTMWGQGYARAMAVDPKDPMTVYLGIDGDPSQGNSGGGIFKSTDGGYNWKQLLNQPGSRRMFFGLAVDPTDSKRIFWGTCNTGGGLYRSDDAGDSWKLVFKNETWVFNVLVTNDGTIYCPGKNLWRSTDHGNTWKQLTKFTGNRTVLAMEVDPRNPKTMWIAATTWGGEAEGGIYKTTDGGATWQDITGNIGYNKPLLLRFNPATNELWAGGAGLFKMKQ